MQETKPSGQHLRYAAFSGSGRAINCNDAMLLACNVYRHQKMSRTISGSLPAPLSPGRRKQFKVLLKTGVGNCNAVSIFNHGLATGKQAGYGKSHRDAVISITLNAGAMQWCYLR